MLIELLRWNLLVKNSLIIIINIVAQILYIWEAVVMYDILFNFHGYKVWLGIF